MPWWNCYDWVVNYLIDASACTGFCMRELYAQKNIQTTLIIFAASKKKD